MWYLIIVALLSDGQILAGRYDETMEYASEEECLEFVKAAEEAHQDNPNVGVICLQDGRVLK